MPFLSNANLAYGAGTITIGTDTFKCQSFDLPHSVGSVDELRDENTDAFEYAINRDYMQGSGTAIIAGDSENIPDEESDFVHSSGAKEWVMFNIREDFTQGHRVFNFDFIEKSVS